MAWKDKMPYSILKLKCPRCHEGDLFSSKNAYSSKVFDMPERCPKCGQKFEIEPGFYYGAMYVSYGLGVAWFVAFLAAFFIIYPEFSIHVFIITTVVSMVAATPILFRLARAIWIHFFVKYEKGISTSSQSSSEESD